MRLSGIYRGTSQWRRGGSHPRLRDAAKEPALKLNRQGQETCRVDAVGKCLGTAEVVKTGGMAGSRVKRPTIGPNQMVPKLGKQSDQRRRAPGCRQHREAAGQAGRRRLNRLRRKAPPKQGEVVR
jgi:hypothetical protein